MIGVKNKGRKGGGGGTIDQDNKPKIVNVIYADDPTKASLATAVNASGFVGDELEVIHFLGFKLGSRDNETDRIVRFRVLGRGKGDYNDVTASEIDIMSISVLTAEDIAGLPNTQTIDLGEIGTALVSDALNAFTLTTIADPDAFYIWVKGGVNRDYKFIGASGDYGVGGTLTATEADFEWIPSQNGTDDTPNQHVEISLSDLGVATFSEVTGEVVEDYIMANVPYLQAQNLEVTVVEPVVNFKIKASGFATNNILTAQDFQDYLYTDELPYPIIVNYFSLVGDVAEANISTQNESFYFTNFGVTNIYKFLVENIIVLVLDGNNIETLVGYELSNALSQIDLRFCGIENISNYTTNENVTAISFDLNPITSISFSDFLPNNRFFRIGECPLVVVNVDSEQPNVEAVYFYGCALNEKSVNDILIWADSSPNVSLIYLHGGTNASPTALGITAKNSLISKGVSVQTN